MVDNLWDFPAESERDARERVDELRLHINEEVGDVFSGPEYHQQLARLYVEWALEHVQDYSETGGENSYTRQAETDLKNIILRF